MEKEDSCPEFDAAQWSFIKQFAAIPFQLPLHPVTFWKATDIFSGMNSFPLLPDKLTQLDRRMKLLGVRESDIEELFVRSGGAGGQKVNKSSSCVMLLHRPTGLRVKCQTSRHQGLNRFLARRLLLDKIERMQKGYLEAERAQIEKVRRQKRKRSRSAKERMLAEKARQGEKKRLRGPVPSD